MGALAGASPARHRSLTRRQAPTRARASRTISTSTVRASPCFAPRAGTRVRRPCTRSPTWARTWKPRRSIAGHGGGVGRQVRERPAVEEQGVAVILVHVVEDAGGATARGSGSAAPYSAPVTQPIDPKPATK